MSFAMHIRQTGNVSIVELTGRLTCFEINGFHDMIHALLKQGHSNIILNLTRLEYLDSSGIGELARAYVSTVKHGGAMRAVGLAPKIDEILKITQLYQVFPEFRDEASALDSFAGTHDRKAAAG